MTKSWEHFFTLTKPIWRDKITMTEASPLNAFTQLSVKGYVWRTMSLWKSLKGHKFDGEFEKNSDSDQLDTIKITVAVTRIKWCGLDHSSSRNGFWVLHRSCVWVSQGETHPVTYSFWNTSYFGMITKNFSGLSQIKIFRQNFLQFLLTSYYLGSMRF